MFSSLGILKVDQVFQQQCLLLLWKYRNNHLPPTFNNYFSPISHAHHTRQTNFNYLTLRHRNRYGQYSPSNLIIAIWNSLPHDIKSEHFNLFQFKKVIFSILINVYSA